MKYKALVTAAALSICTMTPLVATAADMTVEEVIAQGCTSTPSNFSLDENWNEIMDVIPSFCDHPEITKPSINGKRKPKAFVYGSPTVQHDVWAAGILNGDGHTPDDLGISPNTDISWGAYCFDATEILYTAQEGDVTFSLREWDPTSACQITSPLLKTIPVVGMSNERVFVGNTRNPNRIQVSTGSNYGKMIDYYTTGSRRMSYAIPEFAGIVIALNSALIANNKPPLTMTNVKAVLDASSDQAYLEINGVQGLHPESQVDTLLQQNPNNKYFGQIVNLQSAISFALTGNTGGNGGNNGGGSNPGNDDVSTANNAAMIIPILTLLLGE